jgi:hypothetical protein
LVGCDRVPLYPRNERVRSCLFAVGPMPLKVAGAMVPSRDSVTDCSCAVPERA